MSLMTPKYLLGEVPAVKMYISCFITSFALEVAVGMMMLDDTDGGDISQNPVRERVRELLSEHGPPDPGDERNAWRKMWGRIDKGGRAKDAKAVAIALFPAFYEKGSKKWLLNA